MKNLGGARVIAIAVSKSETGNYKAHLNFMQLPNITWKYQEFKAFLMKMNHIIH